ncbi:chitin elicitor receptor kinase 1-like isoform X1 [Chenopodium quinoa]|uniref:chitin elicitor receptor kinase 1-like isoform X1 n=1 Tax=Chenopodium quinoa TaxID=63459 RepID=UPI000B78D386|nr:chitin elicitor receptor kinase 1-like isoform X1 [Chenopodium quinoa]
MSLQTKLLPLWFLLLWISSSTFMVQSKCKKGCQALASYYVWNKSNFTFITQVLNVTGDDFLSYNPSIPDKDRVPSFVRVNVPYSCDCLNNGDFLGQIFQYKFQKGDTYDVLAHTYYSNLTTVSLIQKFNDFPINNVPENSIVNIPVSCYCGSSQVDKKYGLFLTYPLRPEDSLSSVARFSNSTPSLLQKYNPNVDFNAGTGIVFLPAKDKTGQYPPLPSSSGLSGAVIAVISVAVVAVVIMLAVLFLHMRRKKKKKASLFLDNSGEWLGQSVQGSSRKTASSLDAGNRGVTVDKSVEFSYEELALATDNFSMANKIGSGGFGDVYYAELRGEKAAVKKMDMQASKEFLAELQVLTRVHHLNLVRLIGYCVEECLFLVYEFIENGNLSQHLRGTGKEPLPWSTRVQIALDSARGLEYIHEHTVPVYIHRDIKSANILIDKSCHAKVADFGLTKLTEVGNYSAPTRLVGTFGYMPPEYAQYGEVSPKVDVYAFGVVLYELISAKAAVVKQNASGPDSKGLVGMFEAVLKQQNDQNEIRKLVDPRLGDDYPLDSVFKVAQLAYKCTQEDPHLRPSMRSVVVNLMTLSSTTGEWDTGTFYESRQGSLVSAR